MQRTISMRALGYTLFSLSLAHLGHVWGSGESSLRPLGFETGKAYGHGGADAGRKTVNFYMKKPNLGFLYNRGSRNFLAKGPKNAIMSVNNAAPKPMRLGIVSDTSHWSGTFHSILQFEDQPRTPYYGRKSDYESNQLVPRISIAGSINQKAMNLLTYTNHINRMVFSPPYYVGDSGFKIHLGTDCLSVDTSNNLVKIACVEDHNGTPTDENNRQLFDWCSEDSETC
ncbi:hypothetical protein NEDG_02089 [Nematocida displodere]|uniref:Uncharacterized protein n=1 Tax=Nematocida displodere TaxID=1805483 RepID=A0A177ELC7_9MICR|nr:hypothetical protein NEDG_02089 [Nematocida displodere]